MIHTYENTGQGTIVLFDQLIMRHFLRFRFHAGEHDDTFLEVNGGIFKFSV